MKEFKQAGPERQPSGANMIFNPGHNLHFQSVNAILWDEYSRPQGNYSTHRGTHLQAI